MIEKRGKKKDFEKISSYGLAILFFVLFVIFSIQSFEYFLTEKYFEGPVLVFQMFVFDCLGIIIMFILFKFITKQNIFSLYMLLLLMSILSFFGFKTSLILLPIISLFGVHIFIRKVNP